MATNYSTLLGLALPTQGELSGTWGDTVNNYITNYLDSAVAGTLSLATDADVTLSKTTNAALGATSSQYAIINCSGARTLLRTITAPAASKIYILINGTTGGFGVKLVGAGPTTGVTVAAGTVALIVWDTTAVDFKLIGVMASGAVPVANGGTGASTFTAGQVLLGNGTAALQAVAPTAVVGTLLTSTGSAWAASAPSIVQNSQAAPYTLVLADAGKHIYMSSAGAFTIPANASVPYPIGTAITFINMNATASTIPITTDTMYLAGQGTTGTRTLAQYGAATAVKMTATTWLISGSGLT